MAIEEYHSLNAVQSTQQKIRNGNCAARFIQRKIALRTAGELKYKSLGNDSMNTITTKINKLNIRSKTKANTINETN